MKNISFTQRELKIIKEQFDNLPVELWHYYCTQIWAGKKTKGRITKLRRNARYRLLIKLGILSETWIKRLSEHLQELEDDYRYRWIPTQKQGKRT